MIRAEDVTATRQDLGARPAALRQAAGHNQDALARLLVASRSSIVNIDVGRQVGTRGFGNGAAASFTPTVSSWTATTRGSPPTSSGRPRTGYPPVRSRHGLPPATTPRRPVRTRRRADRWLACGTVFVPRRHRTAPTLARLGAAAATGNRYRRARRPVGGTASITHRPVSDWGLPQGSTNGRRPQDRTMFRLATPATCASPPGCAGAPRRAAARRREPAPWLFAPRPARVMSTNCRSCPSGLSDIGCGDLDSVLFPFDNLGAHGGAGPRG